MTDDEAVKATLIGYYKAIGAQNFDTISKYFTNSMTIVSLSGSRNLIGKENIADLYRKLWEGWSARGISAEMGYADDEFVILPVQPNCKLAKTQLTNFDVDGNQLQTWNCTYVMVKERNDWLISLATTDNRVSADWQEK